MYFVMRIGTPGLASAETTTFAWSGEQWVSYECGHSASMEWSAPQASVIPLFRKQRENGRVTVTDARMTRFWITLDQGVRFVIDCAERMHGGEVFVPKIPSMNIMDLAGAIAPRCEIDEIGIRPGEKIHEILVSEDEARHAVELDDSYVIQPAHPWWAIENWSDGNTLPDGFFYSSENNSEWLDASKLRAFAGEED